MDRGSEGIELRSFDLDIAPRRPGPDSTIEFAEMVGGAPLLCVYARTRSRGALQVSGASPVASARDASVPQVSLEAQPYHEVWSPFFA